MTKDAIISRLTQALSLIATSKDGYVELSDDLIHSERNHLISVQDIAKQALKYE